MLFYRGEDVKTHAHEIDKNLSKMFEKNKTKKTKQMAFLQ